MSVGIGLLGFLVILGLVLLVIAVLIPILRRPRAGAGVAVIIVLAFSLAVVCVVVLAAARSRQRGAMTLAIADPAGEAGPHISLDLHQTPAMPKGEGKQDTNRDRPDRIEVPLTVKVPADVRGDRDLVRSPDSIASAVAEAVVRFQRKFRVKEPHESAPGLIVIPQTADGWLTGEHLDAIASALAERGHANEVVFDESEAATLPEVRYAIELERSGTADGGVLTALCRGYFPKDKVRIIRCGDIRYGSHVSAAACDAKRPGIGGVAGVGFLALFITLAYLFVDVPARGRYHWPVRIGSAAAFIAVCVFVWHVGPLM